MKIKRLLAAFFAGLLALTSAVAAENDPVANPKAQVIAGNARFTVLTDRLIRMEWAENGQFEDNEHLRSSTEIFLYRHSPLQRPVKACRSRQVPSL